MKFDIELTPREDVPQWLVYGTPVFTVVAALGVSALALVALGFSPIVAYQTMFVETLTTEFGLTETAIRAIPLILAGLAVYIPLKANLWNIGAEGQLLCGAVVATAIGLNISVSTYLLLPLMFLGATLAGALWGGIPGYLRAKWGINEIITTLLFTFIAIHLLGYLVRGPMQGGEGNFPQTARLPDAAMLPEFLGIGVNVGILLALLAVVGSYALVNWTHLGFEITFMGSNAQAAQQAGMSKAKVYLFVLVLGGALAALAGFSEIAGNQGRLRASFNPGYGFTAIPIALLGRNGAFKVLLAAVFFAVLFVGGNNLSIALGVPSALIEIIQALIILFLITAEFFKEYSVDISVRQPEPATADYVGGDA